MRLVYDSLRSNASLFYKRDDTFFILSFADAYVTRLAFAVQQETIGFCYDKATIVARNLLRFVKCHCSPLIKCGSYGGNFDARYNAPPST